MANILVGGVNLKTLGLHGGIANVSAYGAKGDDSTDDLAIIQSIVDALETIGGGVIGFPAGKFLISGPIVNDSRVINFRGLAGSSTTNTSAARSQIHLVSSTAGHSAIRFDNTSSADAAGGYVSDLEFRGQVAGPANQVGILFSGRWDYSNISRCQFLNFTGYAIAHDSSVLSTYNQSVSIEDVHSTSCGGFYGLTTDPPATGYYSGTLLEMRNVAVSSGNSTSPQPYYVDLRGAREVLIGNIVIQGAGVAGMTGVMAFATGTYFQIDNWHYEITSNHPTYFMAIYGQGSFGPSGQKRIKIGYIVGLPETGCPTYFENSSSNETLLRIDQLNSYDSTSIEDLFEWQDGIEVNESGSVSIGNLEVKTAFKIPDKYFGRVSIGMSGADHQSRVVHRQSARRLFSWNPSMGSMIRHWGQVQIAIATGSPANVIEADGDILCQRFTGEGANLFPRLTFRVYGDNYEGAVATILIRYRTTIDAADIGTASGRVTAGSGLEIVDWYNEQSTIAFLNSTVYETFVSTALMLSAGADPNRTWNTASLGTLTVAADWRIAAVEIWLGTPEHYDLATVGVPVVNTFSASDATPSVSGFKTWKTGTSTLTITDLDDFPAGEERTIISKGAITFDTTGSNLVGSSVDIVTASGDVTKWVSEDGTTKRLISFSDVSTDQSVDNT